MKHKLTMLSSHIGTVLKQALTTFTTKPDLFYQNQEILKVLLDKTTADDVNLHPQFTTEELWKRPKKAPVTYIDMYEDFNITMGIFILKPNMKLPLHNHPEMHGLIKVISGSLKISSYSVNTDRVKEIINERLPPRPGLLYAEYNGEVTIDTRSDCCLLDPNHGNLHEIESVGGPAAFIDILSPPYESDGRNGGRKCSYFQVIREVAPKIVCLQEIDSPPWYWTDSFHYSGPELPSFP